MAGSWLLVIAADVVLAFGAAAFLLDRGDLRTVVRRLRRAAPSRP